MDEEGEELEGRDMAGSRGGGHARVGVSGVCVAAGAGEDWGCVSVGEEWPDTVSCGSEYRQTREALCIC